MHRARRAVFGTTSPEEEYEPLAGAEDDAPREEYVALGAAADMPFLWFEYCIFGFLGVSMLWAWNMFLAAAPYFSSRFSSSPGIQSNFQSGILAVSTVTNLSVLVALSKKQHSASYPFRINLALLINSVVFTLLTASTVFFLDASPAGYLGFLLGMVALSSWATGLVQNGAFAFAASYGRPEYTQALMAGQGVAGVLPALAQVATVLLFPPREEASSAEGGRRGETSAFLYFSAAVAISVAALVAMGPLLRRRNRRLESRTVGGIAGAEAAPARKAVPLRVLFRKLRWLATGVAVTLAVTMFFPVFTPKIRSVHEHDGGGALFRPAAFIPLGFVFWNLGDLAGRVAAALPLSVQDRPVALFLLAAARVALLPLYLLCNIGGRGALVPSDFFYLFVVQLVFGLTNGWLGSSFMMAAGQWVDEDEREATGAFMSLFLVIGLTVGSLLSFTVSGM